MQIFIGVPGAIDGAFVRQVCAPERFTRLLQTQRAVRKSRFQLDVFSGRFALDVDLEYAARIVPEHENRVGAIGNDIEPVQRITAREIREPVAVAELRQFAAWREGEDAGPDVVDRHAADFQDARAESAFEPGSGGDDAKLAAKSHDL